MTAFDEPISEMAHAKKQARNWLRAQIELEYIERPPASAMYGLDPAQEWVFRVPDDTRRFVGNSRYVAVNHISGRVTSFEAGE